MTRAAVRYMWVAYLGTWAVAVASCAVLPNITLTEAAQTACKGQAAANVATDAALLLGQPGAAATASAISAGLGVLCKW